MKVLLNTVLPEREQERWHERYQEVLNFYEANDDPMTYFNIDLLITLSAPTPYHQMQFSKLIALCMIRFRHIYAAYSITRHVYDLRALSEHYPYGHPERDYVNALIEELKAAYYK